MSKKILFLILLLIIIFGFAVRLYRFDNPIADWHSWRQADTSSVSVVFSQTGFDFLHPKYMDLSNVPSGLDNPQGYRFVEFPIYNGLQAGLFNIFNLLTIEQWGRIISIIASLLSVIFIFLLVRKRAGPVAALFSAFFFTFLPFNIYYGRTILPDSSMVAASLGGIYFFDRWIYAKDKKRFLFSFLSFIFLAGSFLLKPYALFFALPLVYLSYERYGLTFLKKWYLWIFLILSLVPLVFWRYWMLQFPEGIPASDWLFNAGNIRFKGSFFYWIFGDRLARLILGFWGLPLLVFGFLNRNKYQLFFLSFFISAMFYLFIIAAGNVQHDYYQILIMPWVSIYLGLGAAFLVEERKIISRFKSLVILVVCIVFMMLFSWYFVRDYFNVNNWSIVKAGEAVDRIVPKDAKVIANYNGDTSFLYQTKRQGWASFQNSLLQMEKMGADYLVLVNPTDKDLEIGEEFKIIAQTKEYVIFDLHQQL